MTGQDAINAVRVVFPRASDEEAHSMLWGHTGFPGFWHTDDPRLEIIRSMKVLKATLKKERCPCDFCNQPAMRKGTLCVDCERGWVRMHEEMAKAVE